jgi:hypothetical protein
MRIPSRSRLACIACATLLFSACAGGKGHASRSDAVAGRAYAGKTLAVLLPDSAAGALDKAHDLETALRDAFPGDTFPSPGAILVREFDEAFWSAFAPAIDYVTPVLVPDTLPPAPADRRVGFSLPKAYALPAHAYAAPDSTWLAEHGVNADLILAIGPISATVQQEEISAYQFGGTVMINRLVLQGWYLLWDYSAHRAIAQGRFGSKVEYRKGPQARDWVKAFDQAMQAVGDATPFRGPKWNRR